MAFTPAAVVDMAARVLILARQRPAGDRADTETCKEAARKKAEKENEALKIVMYEDKTTAD